MEDGKLPLANSYFPMLVVFPGPSCIPGLGFFLFLLFLFVLSQTEEPIPKFGNQPCHPPWKRRWLVVPADVEPAAARGCAESPLQLPHPEELAGSARHDLLRCESDQGGSNLRGLELYR